MNVIRQKVGVGVVKTIWKIIISFMLPFSIVWYQDKTTNIFSRNTNMPETSPSSKMKINCDQDWNGMSFLEGGRFCEVCRKKVHDFTHYSNLELDNFLQNNSEVCGRFRVEQVDRDLIAPIQFPYKLKILTWAAGLLFSLESYDSLAQQQDSVKTELNSAKQNSDTYNLPTAQTNNAALPEVENSKPKKRHKARRRKRIYLSRRFPFFRIQRSRHLMGFW